MNKFMALIKKDFYVSRKSLMTPIWIVVGFYGFLAMVTLYALIRGNVVFNSMINIHSEEIDSLSPFINYTVNFVSVISSGLLALLATIMVAQSALNEDFKRNYELFHRTQPVSIWLKSLSKFTISVVGGWIVFFIIASVNFILINIAFSIWHQSVPDMAFSAFFQGIVVYMKAILVIGSLTFFASSLFKDKAFLSGLGVLAAAQVLTIIINEFFNLHLPLPFNLIGKLLFISKNNGIAETTELEELHRFVKMNWKVILWNMQTVYQIFVSTILFLVSTIIYKSKEIKI